MRIGCARAGRMAALAAAVLVVVAACGSGATPSPAATDAPASATPVASSESPSGTPAPSEAVDEYQVGVATDETAGAYLTGRDGLALYIFTNDKGPTSTCYDECATAWPPLLAASDGAVPAAPGSSGTFATTDRTDGTKQVTYEGAPLYYFAGDAAPGDVNGEGLNDVWFLAKP